MKLIIKKYAIYHYLMIYLLLLFQGGVIFKPFLDYFVVGTIILSGWFIFKKILYNKVIDKTILFIFILSSILLLTSIISAGSLSLSTVLNIISRFMLVYFVYQYDKENFCFRMVKIVVFLSVLSLIGFFISLINMNIFGNIFIRLIYDTSMYYWSPFFCILQSDASRNIGIYGEPGLHQIAINVVLFLLLFYDESELKIKANTRIKYITIMIITILTIQSTTGFISTIVLFIGYIFQKKDLQKKRLNKVLIGAIILLTLLVSFQGTESFIYKNFINKIANSEGAIDLNVSTGRSRTVSMIADIQVALKHPLGAGFEIYEDEWRNYLVEYIPDLSSPVGLTKSLATIGIPSTLIIMWFYIRFAWKNRKSFISFTVYLFMLINTSLAQPVFWFPVLLVIPLVLGNKIVKSSNINVKRNDEG
ncbi:hypothetical protein V5E38_18570 [Rossellomorea sp. GAMAL-10_SWC]